MRIMFPALALGFEFDTEGQLRAGLFISLVSVWMLVAVFAYLNYYTRRKYFSIWTMAWVFYALYLTFAYSLFLAYGSFGGESWWATMVKQWCISTAAIFMLWGGLRFLGKRIRQITLGLFVVFLLCWSFVANYPVLGYGQPAGPAGRLALQIPIFMLIGCSSLVTVWGFFQYRRRRKYLGAGLLCFGFIMWGLFVAAYPFMERLSDYMSTGFFCASLLQMFIAVNMIILVLEQIRYSREKRAAYQLQSKEIEKEQLEKRIVLTEERYRLLFEQSSEPIIITTQENLRIVGINRAAARVLGLTKEEACRSSLLEWLERGEAGASRLAPGHAWFDSLCHERIQTLCRKDGSHVKIEVFGTPVDFAGETAFQFYVREVTERSKIEQQLRQAEKLSALGQMTSGVVHELSNPVTVACGYIEICAADPQLPEEARKHLTRALGENHRAARLLRNFLNLTRRGGPDRVSVDLNAVLRDILELRAADFRKGHIEMTQDLAPELPVVLASLDQLQQIIIILLNNALQALETTAEPRRLKISTRRGPERVLVAVEDSGSGVPADMRSKIFEPFFTTKPLGVGTGLGLSLAHTFAMEHHGRIYCDDSPLGGARFTVELPLPSPAPATPGAEPARGESASPSAPATIPAGTS